MREPIKSNQFLDLADKGSNSVWRYVATLSLVFAGFLGLSFLLALAAGFAIIATQGSLDTFELTQFPQAVQLLIVLMPFVLAMGCLLFAVRYIHRRPIRNLFTVRSQLAWKTIVTAAGVYFLLAALAEGLLYLVRPENYLLTFQPQSFLPALVIVVILIPLQVTAEEALFRGYLLQAFGRLVRPPWVPIMISGIVFGLFHILNPEVMAYGAGIMMAYYIGYGLFMGLLTLLTGGLELAIGVHLATNLYASLFVTFPSSALSTPAVVTLQELDPFLAFVVWLLTSLLFAAIMLRGKTLDFAGIFRRR